MFGTKSIMWSQGPVLKPGLYTLAIWPETYNYVCINEFIKYINYKVSKISFYERHISKNKNKYSNGSLAFASQRKNNVTEPTIYYEP